MTKDNIQDWDATAANNTDIGGVNINEGCAPSGLNNAIREKMAQIKNALSGADTSLVTGTAGAENSRATWNADGDLVSDSTDLLNSLRLIGYAYISNGSSGTFTVSYEEGFSTITRTNPNPVSYNFTFDTARASGGYLIMTQTYTGDRTLGVASIATTGFSILSREASTGTGADSIFAVMVYERV